MRHKNWVDSKKLEEWANSLSARAVLPQLVRRLVHATLEPSLIQRMEFPSGENIQRPGIDGITETTAGNANVPSGKTAWEMGCDAGIKGKADGDFSKRTPEADAVFIFVTPRKWPKKKDWSESKLASSSWRDVRVYDSADLEEWLELSPAVDIWLAHQIGLKPTGAFDLATHWKNLASLIRIPLGPPLVLTDRKEAVSEFRGWLRGAPSAIAIEAPSPAEVIDFVAGLVASLDAPEQDSVASRGIVVEDREAWRALSGSSGRLLLIAGPQLELEPELIAEAVRQGNHIVLFSSRHKLHRGTKLKLGRMFQTNLYDALRSAGASSTEAQRFAREAGGNFTILKRLLSQTPALAIPRWSQSEVGTALVPLLLAGGWDETHSADTEVLSRLSGRPYPELIAFANRLRVEVDAPLMRIGSCWGFVSRADSWRLLSWALTTDLLERFEKAAIEVLSEPNPSLELPPDKRYQASILGKTQKFSESLRSGLSESLGLMGIDVDDLVPGDSVDSHLCAGRVISRLLNDADWQRWASLSAQFPDFAEAAPEAFLQAVEADLRQTSPALVTLFSQGSDGIFGSSPHTGLLWALEVLAWEPRFLGRASLALLRLSAFDPGGRLSNRPRNSLLDIFRSWHPHTNASYQERLAVLGRLLKEEPDAAWRLLVGLLPKRYDSTSGTYKPMWQNWLDKWTEGVTQNDYTEYVHGVAGLLLANAVGNVERWNDLGEHIDELPGPAFDRVLSGIQSAAGPKTQAERFKVWSTLRAKAAEHRWAQGLDWALPEVAVEKLEATVATLTPGDSIDRSVWLFDSGVACHVGNHSHSFDEIEAVLTERRIAAVREVWNEFGFEGLLRLAARAEMPWEVGHVSERAELGLAVKELVAPVLVATELRLKQFACGFLRYRFNRHGWNWLESLDFQDWPPAQAVELLVIIPFHPKLWQIAASLGPEIENGFWKSVDAHPSELTSSEFEHVVSKLRASRRPLSVLNFVDSARRRGRTFSSEYILTIVEGIFISDDAIEEKPTSIQMLQYSITDLIECLQQDPKTDENRLAQLEWNCLKLLDSYRHSPVALHRRLTRDPNFFVEILSYAYPRRSNETKDITGAQDELRKSRAQSAYGLLKRLRSVPGESSKRQIDKAALTLWIEAAREKSTKLELGEICDIKIGEMLAHASEDSDGSWPCVAVRDVLEELNSEDMFRGFETGVINSRGIVSKSLIEGGAQERDLVGIYERRAERIRAGWPLVGSALQRIAEYYRHRARDEDERLGGR